jgi:pyruvate kinase
VNDVDIIVTVGPRSWSGDMLRALIAEGVRTFRFPYSKETPEHHARVHERLRAAAAESAVEVRAWADLPGGKPRLDNTEAREIVASRTYRIALWGDAAADFRVEPPMLRGTRPASFVVGDGPLAFAVDDFHDGVAIGRFGEDAVLQPTRGFMPAGGGSIAVLTDRDRIFARHARDAGMEGVALSFVAAASDVVETRTWLAAELGWRPPLMAKIELPEAVRAAGEIADAADAVMFARGDLALTAGLEQLWWSQKRVLEACAARSRPAVVATGLIESSETALTLTRSNAIDIGTALDMGASALLLAAETTIGPDPLAAVKTLRRQIRAWMEER